MGFSRLVCAFCDPMALPIPDGSRQGVEIATPPQDPFLSASQRVHEVIKAEHFRVAPMEMLASLNEPFQ